MKPTDKAARRDSLLPELLEQLPPLLSVVQTAHVAGVSDRTIRRWLAVGLLNAHRIQGTTRIRIKRDELLQKMGLLEAAP